MQMKRLLPGGFWLCAALLTSPLLGADEVWNSDRTIDSPVEMLRKTLRIRPGVTVSLVGNGSLLVRDGALVCDRVTFVSDSVLTNRFRISASQGRAEFRDCTFRNIRSKNPAGKHYIDGGILVNGGGSCVVHCTFVGCSPVMFTNAHGSEIERNLVVGGDMGFSLLECRDMRIANNEFYGVSNIAVKVSAVKGSELFMNRFTRCHLGVRLYHCKDDRLVGNAFFEGETGIVQQGCAGGIVRTGSRFEDVKREVWERK